MLELHTLKSLDVTCASVKKSWKRRLLWCASSMIHLGSDCSDTNASTLKLSYKINHQTPARLRLHQSLCSSCLIRIIQIFVISLLKRNNICVHVLQYFICHKNQYTFSERAFCALNVLIWHSPGQINSPSKTWLPGTLNQNKNPA